MKKLILVFVLALFSTIGMAQKGIAVGAKAADFTGID